MNKQYCTKDQAIEAEKSCFPPDSNLQKKYFPKLLNFAAIIDLMQLIKVKTEKREFNFGLNQSFSVNQYYIAATINLFWQG